MKPKQSFKNIGGFSAKRQRQAPSRLRSLRTLHFTSGILAALAPFMPNHTSAAIITWIGGNADWVDGTGTANWSPADEPDANDDAVFTTANTVHLGSNNAVLNLGLSAGIRLATNDFDLTVDGVLLLTDSGTSLTIGGSASSVSVDFATINSGGRIYLDGGALRIADEAGAGLLDINTGGVLSGQGTIHLDDALSTATSLITNDGTLAASTPGLLVIGMPAAGSLVIPAGNSLARVDLDGTTGNGIVSVGRNQLLDINVALFDSFSGGLNLSHHSTIDVSTPWSISTGSTVDINNGATSGTIPIAANTSFIAGAAFTQAGGTITVIDPDGTLQFDASFSQTGGELVNNGLVVFNANATISAGANFTMPADTSSLTVNPGVEVNIDQQTFNADGGGAVTNVITVGSGGILDLDLGTGGDNILDCAVLLNGGELDVTTTMTSWGLGRSVTVGAATGSSQLNGDVLIYSCPTSIGTDSLLAVNASSILNTGAAFTVAAGATLDFYNAPTFNGGSFTGAGTLRVGGSSQVMANTTIAVNTLDWDRDLGSHTHTIAEGVTFAINSPTFDSDGDMIDSIILRGNGSTLAFNGPAAWRMMGTLTTNPLVLGTAFVHGTSRMVLTSIGGILNANGNTTIDAPVTLGASSTTTVASAATLVLGSSSTVFDGGTVTGDGTLRVGSNSAVQGNSTISVNTFDWDGLGMGSTQTISDGATLTITSPVFDADGDMDDPLTIGGNGATLTISGPASWEMKAMLTTNPAAAGLATINGNSRLVLTTGTGIFNARGDTAVNCPIVLGPSSEISVAAGARLKLQGSTTTFDGPATVSGAGTLVVNWVSTTSANTTINVNNFDWDGSGIGSLHTINDGATLTISSPVFDDDGDMDDPITLGRNATLAVNGPTAWEMRGTLTASPGGADIATVAGSSRMILTSASGIINANGHLTISAPVSFGPSSQANVAATYILRVNGSAIYDGGTITGPGSYYPPLTNYVYAPSTISTTNFDFDYGNWTLNGGDLTVAVNDYELNTGDNSFDNTLSINDATLLLNSADSTFVMDGVMNCYSTDINAAWGGGSDPLVIGNDAGTLDAALNVLGTGVGYTQIATNIAFKSDADVFIDSGATLQLLGIASFDCANGANNAEFTGGGFLQTNRAVDFNEATTLNMTGGSVDLDGADATGDAIYIKGPLVINAATMYPFGNSNTVGTNMLDVNGWTASGSLTVNLDNPAAEWTLNGPGTLAIRNDPASAAATLLAGSDANLNGYIQVTGDVRSTARLDIGGTFDIQTAGKPFHLAGGTVGDPNTLAGGLINGPGILAADAGKALVGYGTINPQISFAPTADFYADDGTLTINGTITSARFVGTRDTDGILNVVNAWDSGSVGGIVVRGGEVKGGTITNAAPSGIEGFGLVTAKVVNNKFIQGSLSGKTLIVQTPANDNDWDGTTETGWLVALSGTLEVRDNAGFAFNGRIHASDGTVYANGFALQLQAASTISLTNGTFKQSAGITNSIYGTVTVGAGTSTLRTEGVSGGLSFNGGTTTLTGNLQLDNPLTQVSAAATFTGSGRLINLPGRQLEPATASDLNVLVENRGTLAPGGTGVARNDMLDYVQTAAGSLAVNLNGPTVGDFDRLIVDGNAQLAGSLQLSLGGGYVPALNDTLTVVSATAGVTGTFAPLTQPAGTPAGLAFEAIYNPTSVQLKVVSSSTFDAWINSFGIANPADRTKGANPDGDSLNNLGEFATDGNPASGANNGKVFGKIAPVGGVNAYTLTVAMRDGTVLDPADPAGGELGLKQTADGLFYKIQASDELGAWSLAVDEVTDPDATAIQADLPEPNPGWTYRTFRSPGPVAGDPMEFMRIKISD